MDLNALKQKLDTLQSKPQGGQKTDYTTIFWRPSVGKQQIRIVPSAYDASNPFTELKFYYGITNKVMISPLNFGKKTLLLYSLGNYVKVSIIKRIIYLLKS